MRFLFLAALVAINAMASDFQSYSYVYGGKEIHARVAEVEGVKVNDLCHSQPKKCTALIAFRGKSKIPLLKGTRQGNFSGAYCELLGGSQLFAAHAKEAAIPFCVFQDLTFVDANALYLKHSKKSRSGK